MNSSRISVIDAICSAHIPAEFSRSGALGRGRVGSLLMSQSTVRKKMATGTLTYNALRTKSLKDSIKTQRKNCNSFKLDKGNTVSTGTTAVKHGAIL